MRIAFVSLAPLEHDSRILRHARALADAGYDVRILAEGPPPRQDVGCQFELIASPRPDWWVRTTLIMRQGPASLIPASAHWLYWLSLSRWRGRAALLRFRPHVVIANDWKALPLAAFARQRFGARVIYDSHEFATTEFDDSRLWRLLAKGHVVAIEQRHIRSVDAVLTVSDGIADELARTYALARRPNVIRNHPTVAPVFLRRTGECVTVLYHGVIAPRRGLEQLVDSVQAWPPAMRLVIRGPQVGGFLDKLRRRPAASDPRVAFEPAVPPDRLVQAASFADIGVFLLEGTSPQSLFALPNKIFEYMAAGLMVLSSDLPDIRRVVTDARCGVLLPDTSPHTIAAALTRIATADIDAFKQASLAAAARDGHNAIERLCAIVEDVGREAVG